MEVISDNIIMEGYQRCSLLVQSETLNDKQLIPTKGCLIFSAPPSSYITSQLQDKTHKYLESLSNTAILM